MLPSETRRRGGHLAARCWRNVFQDSSICGPRPSSFDSAHVVGLGLVTLSNVGPYRARLCKFDGTFSAGPPNWAPSRALHSFLFAIL